MAHQDDHATPDHAAAHGMHGTGAPSAEPHGAPGEEHHGGMRQYFAVFLALLVLTVISFGVGSSPLMTQTPSLGRLVMVTVSCAKALLVLLFFMHLLWEANWKYILTIPAGMMSIFLVIMLTPDVGYRVRHYSEQRWLHAATDRSDDGQEEETDEPEESASR